MRIKAMSPEMWLFLKKLSVHLIQQITQQTALLDNCRRIPQIAQESKEKYLPKAVGMGPQFLAP